MNCSSQSSKASEDISIQNFVETVGRQFEQKGVEEEQEDFEFIKETSAIKAIIDKRKSDLIDEISKLKGQLDFLNELRETPNWIHSYFEQEENLRNEIIKVTKSDDKTGCTTIDNNQKKTDIDDLFGSDNEGSFSFDNDIMSDYDEFCSQKSCKLPETQSDYFCDISPKAYRQNPSPPAHFSSISSSEPNLQNQVPPPSSTSLCSQFSAPDSSPKGRKGRRNRYKMYSAQDKEKAIELAVKYGANNAAEICKVPLKNLKRWMKVGAERKKGGGRKTKDPQMEQKVYQWYLERKTAGLEVNAKMVKEKAIECSNCNDFIASKGWLDKFKTRFGVILE